MNTLTRCSAITASASVTCWAVAMRPALAEEAPPTGVAALMTAPEDLMREHGVLNRLMLKYEAELTAPASALERIHEVLHEVASLMPELHRGLPRLARGEVLVSGACSAAHADRARENPA